VNAFWSYFWPALGVGLLFGVVAGAIGFRPRARRTVALLVGAVAAVAGAAIWHGPLGAADRFRTDVDRSARQALVDFEIPQVTAHLHRGPLSRRLILAGPADEFQTAELVRIMSTLPGVSRAQWRSAPAGTPLLVEGSAAALLGFLLGLLLAYLVELRRRYNAQWNW
jgi:hypothetical protein